MARVSPKTQQFFAWLTRPVLLLALLLSIPAFYLLLDGEIKAARLAGHALYATTAALMLGDTVWQWRKNRHTARRRGKMMLDIAIIFGCIASAFPSHFQWSALEWLLRLGLCTLIVVRIATLILRHMKPGYLIKLIVLTLLMLTSAGAGFYLLEPTVLNYADGVWLAFSTVATVGYGDFVPSTPASKIFAVFIVLLGYAMFSIVTANIAALFVGEEEAKFERELHGDIRALHQEVAALRRELRAQEGQIIASMQAQSAHDEPE
ncbi:potassium channel family protein [Undibacterium sp. Ren11W]|uniref:potassium channel family protein n=1 Tax=Undibacterium sp. Ren11W TaxID=3413045 RepID=UPI003BF1EA0E